MGKPPQFQNPAPMPTQGPLTSFMQAQQMIYQNMKKKQQR